MADIPHHLTAEVAAIEKRYMTGLRGFGAHNADLSRMRDMQRELIELALPNMDEETRARALRTLHQLDDPTRCRY